MHSPYLTPVVLLLSSLVAGHATPGADAAIEKHTEIARRQCPNCPDDGPSTGSGPPVAPDHMIYGYQESSQPSGPRPPAVGSVSSSFGGPDGSSGGFGSYEPPYSGVSKMPIMREMDNGMPQQSSQGSSMMGSNMGSSAMLPSMASPLTSMEQNDSNDADDYGNGDYYPEFNPNDAYSSNNGGNPYGYTDDNGDDYDNDNGNDDTYPNSDHITAAPVGSATVPVVGTSMTMSTSSAVLPIVNTGSPIPTGTSIGGDIYTGTASLRTYSGICWAAIAVAIGAVLV